MKNLLLTTALFFCFLIVGNSQVSFGVGASYWNDFGVQARANIEMASFDIIPKFTYYFTDGATVMALDADVAFDVANIGDDTPIYAFAGPSLRRFSADLGAFGSVSSTDLGINIGAGARFSNIYVEAKYGFLLCDGCGGDIGFAAGYMF